MIYLANKEVHSMVKTSDGFQHQQNILTIVRIIAASDQITLTNLFIALIPATTFYIPGSIDDLNTCCANTATISAYFGIVYCKYFTISSQKILAWVNYAKGRTKLSYLFRAAYKMLFNCISEVKGPLHITHSLSLK